MSPFIRDFFIITMLCNLLFINFVKQVKLKHETMKKVALIILMTVSFVGCNKNSKREVSPDEAYCIYEHPTVNQKVFISCEKSSEDAQKKCTQLRNSGHSSVESVKKSTCSDC